MSPVQRQASPGSGETSPLPLFTRKGENMQPQCAHVPSAAALLSNVRLGKTATHNRILERLYWAAEVSLSPQKTQAARSARRERFNSGQRIEPLPRSGILAASLSEAPSISSPAGNPGTMKPWSICAPRSQHTPGRPLALGTPSCSVDVYVLLASQLIFQAKDQISLFDFLSPELSIIMDKSALYQGYAADPRSGWGPAAPGKPIGAEPTGIELDIDELYGTPPGPVACSTRYYRHTTEPPYLT